MTEGGFTYWYSLHLYVVFAKGRDDRSVYPTVPNLVVGMFLYFYFSENKIV